MSPTTGGVLLAWSSGKDSAWCLHVLRQKGVAVAGLLTTMNERFDRVTMHGVRRELVEAQARAAGLPLHTVPISWPCPNGEYERRMAAAMERTRAAGITQVAFGDLYLEDVRAYRIEKMRGTGIEPVFPLWGTRADTPALARAMLAGGLRATVTCVDPKQIEPRFSGRAWDETLIAEMPPSVDPCGENGEFHTFCHAGPMFSAPIAVRSGEIVDRDGFRFADLLP